MMKPLLFSILSTCALWAADSGQLHVGWASVSVTPDKPVALGGQVHTRISKFVHDPVMATALAIETRENSHAREHAILISLDGPGREGLLEPLRERLKGQLPGVDLRKIILNVTHTHTAPETDEGIYDVPAEGVMPVREYREYLIGRLAEVARRAWSDRRPAAVSWGLGHAVVGYNRRAVYAGGKAAMYGNTDQPDFLGFEGSEDHTVDLLYFWTPENRLTGVAVNIACPSQEVEGESFISADFWGDVREEFRKRHGPDVHVYAMTSAAGDQSPHLLMRKAAEERMRKLRSLTPTQEIARRIANAVDDVLPAVRQNVHQAVPFRHVVETMLLPERPISAEMAAKARKEVERIRNSPLSKDGRFFTYFHQGLLERYARQAHDPNYHAEVHVIRLGDIAIATNPFELFLDYGLQIEARSKALQTFIVQIACGSGIYLPTAKAIEGGSYSVAVEFAPVGPEGGRTLVEKTVEAINALW